MQELKVIVELTNALKVIPGIGNKSAERIAYEFLKMNPEKIDNLMFNSVTNISFIIGGSLGWSSKLSEVAKERLKLSEMTFTHQMTRVILLEQIYRSFKILRNETYHK